MVKNGTFVESWIKMVRKCIELYKQHFVTVTTLCNLTQLFATLHNLAQDKDIVQFETICVNFTQLSSILPFLQNFTFYLKWDWTLQSSPCLYFRSHLEQSTVHKHARMHMILYLPCYSPSSSPSPHQSTLVEIARLLITWLRSTWHFGRVRDKVYQDFFLLL